MFPNRDFDAAAYKRQGKEEKKKANESPTVHS
jgi:hypothetical protein